MSEFDEECRMYEIYRKRIVEEDTIIHYRMTWFILTEPALFAAFGIVTRELDSLGSLMIAIVVCLAGLFVAWKSWVSIDAAAKQIEFVKEEYTALRTNKNWSKIRLSMVGNSARHAMGHSLDRYLPLVVGFLWFIVGVSMASKHWTSILTMIGHSLK